MRFARGVKPSHSAAAGDSLLARRSHRQLTDIVQESGGGVQWTEGPRLALERLQRSSRVGG